VDPVPDPLLLRKGGIEEKVRKIAVNIEQENTSEKKKVR
jgi:hypothetical protein